MTAIKFTRNTRGTGRTSPNTDGYKGLILNGVAVEDGVQLATSYELNRIEDAEDIGITAEYDIDNKVLVHYHIDEFFRGKPDGKLFIWLTAQTVTLTQMCDKTLAHATQFLKENKGKIKTLGVARNPATGYTATLTTGLDADVLTAIDKAQALCNLQKTLNRPLTIILEGKQLNGSISSVLDLHTKNAGDVAVVILQDLDIAALDALFAKHAAVGTALGACGKRRVNESIGFVGTTENGTNLQDAATGRWLRPGLSNNQPLSFFNDDPETGDFVLLDGKGFLLGETFDDYPGVYFGNDNTCGDLETDFTSIRASRVESKAHRTLYLALIPSIRSTQLIDPETGFLATTTAMALEAIGNEAIAKNMAGEVSGFKTIIDPEQNLITTNNLNVQFEIVQTGTLNKISGTITYKLKLS
jgi:hypothetical protein